MVEGEDLEGLKALIVRHMFDDNKLGEESKADTVDRGDTSTKEGEEETKKRQGECELQADDAKRLKTNNHEGKEGDADDKPTDSAENGDKHKEAINTSDSDDKAKEAAETGDDSKSMED